MFTVTVAVQVMTRMSLCLKQYVIVSFSVTLFTAMLHLFPSSLCTPIALALYYLFYITGCIPGLSIQVFFCPAQPRYLPFMLCSGIKSF